MGNNEKYYPTPEQMNKQGFTSPKIKLAKERGALAVLVVEPSTPATDFAKRIMKYQQNKKILLRAAKYINLYQDFSSLPGEEMPNIKISNFWQDFTP